MKINDDEYMNRNIAKRKLMVGIAEITVAAGCVLMLSWLFTQLG